MDESVADPLLCERLMSNDRRIALVAQREVLATCMLTTNADTTLAMKTSASKELRAINAEINALPVPTEGSKVDALRKGHASRSAGTADSAPAGRRSQPRRSGRGNRMG